ncbi:hypothetical protein GIB67_010316 [Kingdonia uniflora]|uniref:non-specific serine/threonine protein kinase n=1 Tax=Kingdonia uniflora TaxID=39325 RepID=A0A7J7LCT8_9MAGN|nr:hypothetical protein GIB67_010316 [Kingdonia uniflora]
MTGRSSSTISSAPVLPPVPNSKTVFLQKYLWIGVAIGTVIICVCVAMYCCFRHRYFTIWWQKRQGKGDLESKGVQLRRFQLEELEKVTKKFSQDSMIGSGAFGNVYLGMFNGLGAVAIKKAHAESYQSLAEFRNGIAHLHEGVKPSIIHRDIKPSNILVGDGFEAKVSDFGLVKSGPIGDQSHVSSQIKGTPGYLDPAYCTSFHLTPFSDVYSFGVILLQLIAARPAVDTNRNTSRYHITEWARPSLERGNVEDIIDVNLLTAPCNMEMMLKMGELGLRCAVKTPKKRPTMTQVWQELEEALHSTDNYINKQPSRTSRRSYGSSQRSAGLDRDTSQTFSVDGIGLQRFQVELDSISFQSTSMRWLDNNDISIDIDEKNNLG